MLVSRLTYLCFMLDGRLTYLCFMLDGLLTGCCLLSVSLLTVGCLLFDGLRVHRHLVQSLLNHLRCLLEVKFVGVVFCHDCRYFYC